MATFPRTEAGVSELAMQMMTGLAEHADLYPSVTPDIFAALSTASGAYMVARSGQAQAAAAAKNATVAKSEAEAALEDQMRKIINLAEADCLANPSNLDYIGWGDRRPPSPLVKPGDVSGLIPTYEGPGVLTLKWRRPASGGPVSSYRLERSDQPVGGGVPGPWTLITTTYKDTVTLPHQPRGIEMQYRVIATNAAGDSLPSNIATVVL